MFVDARHQRIALLTAVVAFIAILVIIQLWLVGASVEGVLGGDTDVLVPAAVASAVLCGMNAVLLRLGLGAGRRLPADSRDG
jgi:hypothetical protein